MNFHTGCSDEGETESEYESDSEPEILGQSPPDTQFADLFRWLLILILTCHIAHSISGAAINDLLQFIARAFSVTGSILSSPLGVGLSAFPASLYLAYKYLKIEIDDFQKHVLCPKCYTLYDYGEMLKANADGSYSVKRCTHIEFPYHPQRNRRLPCSAPLVRPIHLSSGSKRLYALHCFVRKGFIDSLQ